MGSRKCEPSCTCLRHTRSGNRSKGRPGLARYIAEHREEFLETQRKPERRERISRALTGRKQSEERRVHTRRAAVLGGQAMSRKFAAGYRNTQMSDTSLERAVAGALDGAGVEYRRQVRIGRFIVDFLLEDGRVLEAFGCFWHACPCKGEGNPQVAFRQQDEERLADIRSRGHDVIVVWEHEVDEGRWLGRVAVAAQT
jgi:G:T-mismatch repair DNA endonuclease (very short patch repair protein)